MRGDGARHGAGDRAVERPGGGAAQGGKFVDEFLQQALEAPGGAGVGVVQGGGRTPGLYHQVDRPVLQVQPPAVGKPGGVGAGHGASGAGMRRSPEVYSPPERRMSSRARISGAWPPRAR